MTSPQFIIAGERRSGSTSLFDILNQHPEINMPQQPDLDFFIETELFSRTPIEDSSITPWDPETAAKEYESLFAELKGVTGYKDADLLWWKPAHPRLAKYASETKFIVLLRDPVKRAESQYFNELSKGREHRSFREALSAEDIKKDNQWAQLHLHYKRRGCYEESLSHFYKYIPKENVMIVILEDMRTDFERVIREVCKFLGVTDPNKFDIRQQHSNIEEARTRRSFAKSGMFKPIIDLYERVAEAGIRRVTKIQNKRKKLRRIATSFYTQSSRKINGSDTEILEELKTFYAPYNDRLARLLDREIPW